MQQSRVFQLFIAAILCYSNAFRLYQIKKFQFFKPLHNELIPRTDREISYQSLKNKGVFISSAFLLQIAALAAKPKPAEAVGYKAAPSAFAPNDFLYTGIKKYICVLEF